MKEEDKLLKKVGKGNSFTVPQGYFEHLTSEVMNKLPEQEAPQFVKKEVTMWDRIKPWTYMAAMFIGAALIIRVASSDPNPFDDKQIAAVETVVGADSEMVYDEYIDYVMNQSMLDEYSLYMYLTDASVD